jgi:hypothetical protein
MGTLLEHSSLGPSSWDRWIRCPGSVKAQAGIPDQSRYEAAEGTVFHELVADCLELGFEPEDYVGGGRGLMVDGFWIEYDDEMVQSARDGLDYVRAMVAEPGWQLFVETRVDISKWTLPGQFGTADVILVNVAKRKVIVFDWKYGKIPVYPQENYQLQGYCLGAWQTIFGKLFNWKPEGIDVKIIIEQPRVPGAGGAWDTTMQRVLEFGAYAKRQAALTTSDKAPRVPGPKQCRWCRAKDTCGAHAAWHMEMLDLEFDDLDMAAETGIAPSLTVPEDITPERRSVLLQMKPMLNQWFDALHKAAYHDAKVGNPVPGMKLVDGKRPARKYKANAEHKAETVLRGALGEDAYHPPVLLSPAQAEKKLGKARYVELLDRFVDLGEPQPILVPEEDNRPALESAVDMFDDLSETDDVL